MSYYYWILDRTSWIRLVTCHGMVATRSSGEMDYITSFHCIYNWIYAWKKGSTPFRFFLSYEEKTSLWQACDENYLCIIINLVDLTQMYTKWWCWALLPHIINHMSIIYWSLSREIAVTLPSCMQGTCASLPINPAKPAVNSDRCDYSRWCDCGWQVKVIITIHSEEVCKIRKILIWTDFQMNF